jgi:hypothetical protein
MHCSLDFFLITEVNEKWRYCIFCGHSRNQNVRQESVAIQSSGGLSSLLEDLVNNVSD